DAFGAAARMVSFVAGNRGDDKAEGESLDQAEDAVEGPKEVAGALDKLTGSQVVAKVRDQNSTTDSYEASRNVEHRKHDDSGDHAWRYQIAHGIQAHRFQRIDLLGDAHRTELRGDASADSTGENKSCHNGPELEHHRRRDDGPDNRLR